MNALATMAAALATGVVLGAVLALTYTALVRSSIQERMQRNVLYWQTETTRAREAAEQLIQRLEARDNRPKPPTGRSWQ